MYIKGPLNTSFTTLFQEPRNELVGNTFYKRPSDEFRADYIDSAKTETPVEVAVNRNTMGIQTLNAFTDENASYALNMNSSITSYLETVSSLIEDVKLLAETAAMETTDNTTRAQLNIEANQILSQIDDIYKNASFGSAMTMQGGTGSVATGFDGQAYVYSYGNASRSLLGINSINLSSMESAEDAVDALDGAVSDIDAQTSLIQDDADNILNRLSVNASSVDALKSNAGYEASIKYDRTAYANTMAALGNQMLYALEVQGANLTRGSVSNMLNSLSAISSSVRSAQEAQEEASSSRQEQEMGLQAAQYDQARTTAKIEQAQDYMFNADIVAAVTVAPPRTNATFGTLEQMNWNAAQVLPAQGAGPAITNDLMNNQNIIDAVTVAPPRGSETFSQTEQISALALGTEAVESAAGSGKSSK